MGLSNSGKRSKEKLCVPFTSFQLNFLERLDDKKRAWDAYNHRKRASGSSHALVEDGLNDVEISCIKDKTVQDEVIIP
jgi:hypothetical protein